MSADTATRRQQLRDQFVECRTIGHAWDAFIPHDKRAPQFGARVSLRCLRCSMERHDLVNRITGDIVSRSYDAPDGYRLAEKLTRAQWRRRYVREVRSTPTVRHLRRVK
jgi:hypothetical protein